MLASETAALDIVGAHFVRDVAPGEMVVIDASGVHASRFAEPDPKLCLFEFVYFARPDTLALRARSVHAAAPAHGRGARAPGAGRRRHGDAGARVGHPRRAGLRRARRASPTATAW